MQNAITIESLLAIAIGFISSGVALITANNILIGVIIALIGFMLIATRAIFKKFNC
jgi:hypothetical protein